MLGLKGFHRATLRMAGSFVGFFVKKSEDIKRGGNGILKTLIKVVISKRYIKY